MAVPSRPLPRIPGLPAGMTPTRRCPSCESGMNAPGTRHSAECRKRQAEFASGETAKPSLGDLEDLPVQEGGVRDGSYSPSLAPDPVEPVDVEMTTEDVGDMPMVDVCTAQPYHVGMLTSPELVQRDRFSVESIQYDGYCDEFVVMDFCGQKIKLWKPSGAVSDVTLRDLPAEGTFLAMQKEIRGLTAVGAGQVLAENVARESGQRIIGTRWVTNEKEEAQEGVRARIVAKDFASGQSARSMGISSPTPSIEALRMVLGVACGAWSVGNQAMFLAGLDVSQAFMNSPLERPEILRMPLSMSTMKGEPIFLWAEKGINGLRIASQAWIVFFSSIVKSIGVVSGTVEPCLYVGRMVGKDQAPIVIMAYVDDLLVATTSESALKTLMTALSAHVKVRETGRVGLKGGHLRFLGRIIFRRPGSSALYMQVDPTYLDEAFAEFDLKKGSTTFPDLRPILEQEGSQPLSAEGHARFRRVLGRLSWYCQTRQDLILVSMLGTGQAQPFETHEKCLRAVLRYLMTDMDVALRFPSEELALPDVKGLEVYTDAGFAPMKSTGRRSVSGTCFIFQQCLMKCFSRHQSAVTLSSCEAELLALQSGVQEGIGLLRTLGFVLGRLYPWVDIIPQDAQVTWYDEAESDDEDSMKVSYLFPLVVKTDSLSGKMLLEASDLQRKSRHIEIKVYWLRELMDRKVLLLSHVPGTLNPADCFTKCLPTQKFLFYRNVLGFVKVDFSLISNILGFCLKVCDNSYSKPISCLSNRNCVLCGERLILFVLEEEQEVSGDQRSFRHVKAVVAQASLTDPRTPSLAVAQMAGEEEDNKSMVSGLTRVDYTTGRPRQDPDTGEVMRRDARVMEVTEAAPEGAVASDTQEQKEPVSGTPDTKEATAGAAVAKERPSGEPSSGSGRKPQVKKMPKRPAAKLMPRKRIIKVKSETGSGAKLPGKNRFKNKETKRRQKAKWEEIKRTSKEERAQPAPAFEIPARGGDVPVRSFFDPISGRRETMEVKPIDREQKFRTVQSGFSRYPTETRTCYQCGEKGHLSANCPQKMRRVSLTEGVIKYEGAGETRPRVRLQGNMGSIPQETSEFDDVRPEDSACQVGGQYLGTMSTVGTTKKSLPPPPPPPPMGRSPKIARSRPGVPPQTSATSAPMHPPAPRLPAKFSQDPPPGEVASSSRPDVMRPKTPPKRPPIKTPPVKSVPKKAKATEPTEIKGSVGRVQPRTPSPKRAVEEMARNDAAARGSAPAKAEAAKAPPATVDIVTPSTAVDIVTPVVDSAGHGDAHLVAAQGSGRLSALTVHQPTPVSSQAPTPTSPAGDSLVAGEAPGQGSTHWSNAPVISPPAPVGGETEVCVACQGSGLLNSQVNLRLFRLIGTGQLRLAGQTAQVAPVTPAPAAPATPAPAAPATPAPAAANPTEPGNGTEVSPSPSENSGRSRTPTRSGVCSVTEDGSMTMFDSGGNLLILELACGVDSVIQNASREFGSSYIGIHAGLELLSGSLIAKQ